MYMSALSRSCPPVRNVVLDGFLGAPVAISREQLHKLVLHVLNEVQASLAGIFHEKNGQVLRRFSNDQVEHPRQYSCVVWELDHELLLLLHIPKAVIVHHVPIVEE